MTPNQRGGISSITAPVHARSVPVAKPPLRGILALGADTPDRALKDRLDEAFRKVESRLDAACRRHRTRQLSAQPNGSSSILATTTNCWTSVSQGAQGRRLRQSPGLEGACRPRASSAAAAPNRARSPSSSPARAASTPTWGASWPPSSRSSSRSSTNADAVMTPILGKPLTDLHLRRSPTTRQP